jgi:capsule polysaccharide export protein KpsE/RkpR
MLKAEPRSAAESYARLKAEATNAEVKLQTLRSGLSDAAPEVRQQQTLLSALRAELARVEAATVSQGGPDYVSNYREFKYQETLFELIARQYELARVDESREGALIQVVDEATPPERKTRPRRAVVALTATAVAAFVLIAFVMLRFLVRQAALDTEAASKMQRLRAALRLR